MSDTAKTARERIRHLAETYAAEEYAKLLPMNLSQFAEHLLDELAHAQEALAYEFYSSTSEYAKTEAEIMALRRRLEEILAR